MRHKNIKYARRCRRHSKARAFERCKIEIGKDELAAIAKSIQSGNCRRHPDYEKTATRRVLIVPYEGKELTVVYSKTLKNVVTVLPQSEDIGKMNPNKMSDEEFQQLKKDIEAAGAVLDNLQRIHVKLTGRQHEWLR